MTALLINESLLLHANVNQDEAIPTLRNWHIAEIHFAKLGATKLPLVNDPKWPRSACRGTIPMKSSEAAMDHTPVRNGGSDRHSPKAATAKSYAP